MTVLAKIRNPQDLMIAASLPATAIDWLLRPLTLGDLHVNTTRKPRGGYRTVYHPVDESLVRLQKRLKEFLDRKVLAAHPCVHGFTRGRGTFTNAQSHLGARAILTVDIADFFESIRRPRVEAALQSHGANDEIAVAITNVGTFRNSLATGFSTSPVISNLVFRPLDDCLESFATNNCLKYTRYADDLTFSGEDLNDEHLGAVRDILASQAFRVNNKKVRFQRRGHPQVVTGYVVAHPDRARLPKAMRKRLRQDLYFAGKFGFAGQALFRNLDEDEFKQRLLGRINYLMGAERALGMSMREEFERILETEADSGATR